MSSSDLPPGFLGSFRAFGDSLLASVQGRIELVSIELQEEKFRLIQTYLWISAALFAGTMALTFASLTLVYLFWDSARLAVLVGLTLFYVISAVAIVVAFRRYLARQPRPFAATIEEFKEDRACIPKEN
jgi:uncharacterized membrane protein YqjE